MRFIGAIAPLLTTARKAFLSTNVQTRRANRHQLASTVSGALAGSPMYKHTLTWYREREFREIWSGFPEAKLPIRDKKYTIYQLAHSVTALVGDTAECGVFRGGSSYLILRATEGQGRVHHIYDSFEGASRPTAEDEPADKDVRRWRPNDMSAPLVVVRSNLRAYASSTRYHQGWIPSQFDEGANTRFVFVHIDVDLYQPTLASLKFFYPRVVPGGLIVCDDYGYVDCPGSRRAFDQFMADRPERIVHLTTGQALVVKR